MKYFLPNINEKHSDTFIFFKKYQNPYILICLPLKSQISLDNARKVYYKESLWIKKLLAKRILNTQIINILPVHLTVLTVDDGVEKHLQWNIKLNFANFIFKYMGSEHVSLKGKNYSSIWSTVYYFSLKIVDKQWESFFKTN